MKKYLLIVLSCLFCFSAYAEDKEVLRQAFQTLNEKYIDNVSLAEIVGFGLKAMSKEDKNMKIVSGKNTATIYYKGHLQKVYSMPSVGNNAEEWADFVIMVLEGAKQISPDIKRQDFELTEVFLYEGIKKFDKYSRYYPVLDIGQEFTKPQPYHASMRDGDILYVRLGTIGEQTIKYFNKTMEKYQNLKGIILDLRGNQGGYLKYALQITDMFLSKGTMIYTTGRNKGKRHIYKATKGEIYKQIPMVILVDGQTASSAEVIALVLKEKQRALLVGTQTYGKGTVQNIYKLANGAHLALTTERFYSAKSTSVEETSGVRPDICTTNGETIDELNKPYSSNKEQFCPRAFNKPEIDIDIATEVIALVLKRLENKI